MNDQTKKSPADFISAYTAKVTSQAQALDTLKEKRVKIVTVLFDQYCRVWFGDIWGGWFQYQYGVQFDKSIVHAYANIKFTDNLERSINGALAVDFRFDDGTETFNINTSSPQIVFEEFWAGNRWDKPSIYLDFKRERGVEPTAIPASDESLGQLFLEIGAALEWKEKRDAEQLKKDHENALYFDNFWQGHNVENARDERIAKYPEIQDEIKHAANQRILFLVEREKENQERRHAEELERAQEEKKQSRHRELELIGMTVWGSSCPFKAYKIHYGARADGEGENLHTSDIIVLDLTPDGEGFYQAYQSGTPRRFHPYNISGIEELTIKSQKDCPFELKRSLYITDGVVKTYVTLPPAEIYELPAAMIANDQSEDYS